MGFLNRVKTFFDTGGIKAQLEAPDRLRWQDETLPLKLTLTGHESEPRTIHSIEFRLYEDDRDRSTRAAADRGLRLVYDEPISLKPRESVTLDIVFPLTANAALNQADAEGNVPRWLSTAANALAAGQSLTFGSSDYRISATPDVEGAKIRQSVSRRIQALGRGEFVVGNAALLDD